MTTLIAKIVGLLALIAALVGVNLWYVHQVRAAAYRQGQDDAIAAQHRADETALNLLAWKNASLNAENGKNAAENAQLRQQLAERVPVEVKYVRSVVTKYPVFAAVQRPDELVRARNDDYAAIGACAHGDKAGCARLSDHGGLRGPDVGPAAAAGGVGAK